MTPAARVQAAIEILDLIVDAARHQGAPADRVIADWFRARRFAGSGDRRAVRELAYAAIRACGEAPVSGRAAMLALADADSDGILGLAVLFDGSRHAPAPIDPAEPRGVPGVAPAWLMAELANSGVTGVEAQALLGRAPLDIRVNALKADRATIALPLQGELTAAPQGLRYPAGTQVEGWDAFNQGLIEVQDTGSQLVCEALAARGGETVIDLCAGAGGKTLSLAAAMSSAVGTDAGTLIACDTDRGRLSRLRPRAERAGARIAETLLLDPGRELDALGTWEHRADAVLVDAPCSGSGTWRRNPEARWRLSPRELARLTALQAHVLDLAARLVKPGGRIVYATCSLLDAEGADQVQAFLTRHRGWRADPPVLPAGRAHGATLRLDPLHAGTDGFAIARLQSI